jgi:hypothetical protein
VLKKALMRVNLPPVRLLADTNASFMIEEPTIHTLVSGFPTVIVLNLLDKTMKMKRKKNYFIFNKCLNSNIAFAHQKQISMERALLC